MNRRKWIAHCSLVALTVLATVTSAQAEPFTRISTTPGAACKVNGPADGSKLRSVDSRSTGTRNNSDKSVVYICPVSRSQDSDDTNILVRVAGRVSAGHQVTCDLESVNAAGTIIASFTFTQQGLNATKDFSEDLVFGNNAFGRTLPKDAFLSMRCIMPPRGATIFGIMTAEIIPG